MSSVIMSQNLKRLLLVAGKKPDNTLILRAIASCK